MWTGRAARRVAAVTAPATTARIAGLAPGSTVRFAVRAEGGRNTATSAWVTFTLPG
jgi:hypothetical protein